MGGLAVDIGIGVPRFNPSKGGSDPYRLFANGESGFLFGNFGDLSRLFTTYQGPTNVANDGDAVGLALEDSSWSKRTLLQQQEQSAELLAYPNTFSSWELVGAAVSGLTDDPLGGNSASILTASVTDSNIALGVTPVAGASYRAGVWLRRPAGAKTVNIYQNGGGTLSTKACALTSSWKFFEVWGAPSSTTTMRLQIGGAATFTTGDIIHAYAATQKRVAGNHALQSTSPARPLYKLNSGKPYLSLDGSDDCLITPFRPTAALTMALAFNSATAGGTLMGGGAAGTANRAYLALSASGQFAGGWGTQGNNTILGGGDVRNTDHVGIMTVDATSVDLWLDGEPIYSAAPSGTGAGGSGGIAVGAFNNAGTPTTFSVAREYAALAINRRVTPAEIALITSKFRSAYQ